MATIREAIKILKGMKGQHVALAIWNEDDLLDYAANSDIKLTRRQARMVIDRVDGIQDSSAGINWDTFDYYIGEILDDKVGDLTL